MKRDRFNLEDDIMKCWNVTEDIDMIMERMLDSPTFEGMPAELSDKTANLLIGLKELYNLRFERLWETFEYMLKDGQFNSKLVNVAPSGELPRWVREEDLENNA